ncbi:DNA helicase [Colletotrichum sojae]|uniref:DNA helicase n=1 Tax=Colletotrichum sojae TaxID=2175907 RepID=A0A8H6JQ76_9PEZI|nr:DNA helicase [Colletotrichum sojae]
MKGRRPIVDETTLFDITRQTEFILVIANELKSLGIKFSGVSLPPAFDYGYGKPRPWNKDDYTDLWRESLSSERFEPAYSLRRETSCGKETGKGKVKGKSKEAEEKCAYTNIYGD